MQTTIIPGSYAVKRVQGQSNVARVPDIVANKIMAGWSLAAESAELGLYNGAVPADPTKPIGLEIWEEGGDNRCNLFVDTTPRTNLDRGTIVSQGPLMGAAGGFEIVMRGNYLYKITMGCELILAAKPALAPSPEVPVPAAAALPAPTPPNGVRVIDEVLIIPTKLIRPMKGQPRTYFDPVEIQAFGVELKTRGQQQPAIVKLLEQSDENGCLYELISGERRWTACNVVGIPGLKCIVRKGIDAVEQYVEAVIANCHNVELSLLETMRAVGELHKFGKTDEEIARIFGKKSAIWAEERREALVMLNPAVLRLLGPEIPEEKRIPISTAKLLINIPQHEQLGFAEMIVENGMSTKQVNHLVKNHLGELGKLRRGQGLSDFKSARKFFLRTNDELEIYIDHGDGRVANLFKDRSPGDIAELVRLAKGSHENFGELLKLVKDCYDNLGVVLKQFEAEKKKLEDKYA